MDDLISRQAAIDALANMYRAAEKWGQEAEDDVIKARAESCMASLVEMKLRIEKLPSAHRWVPCSERLPNVNGDYLVTFKYLIFYPVEVCEFKDGKWDSGMYDVVAWMLLPDPYRKNGDENV